MFQCHFQTPVVTSMQSSPAWKYGVTGHWVTGIEAVIPPGEIVTLGGPIRRKFLYRK